MKIINILYNIYKYIFILGALPQHDFHYYFRTEFLEVILPVIIIEPLTFSENPKNLRRFRKNGGFRPYFSFPQGF